MFTLALATTILSISCSKNDAEILEPEESPAAAAPSFVSGWEVAPAWQSSASNGITTYTFRRSTPQLTREQAMTGALVVYTKGYDFEGATKGDKPLVMPFTWIPADERYMHPYKWYYEGSDKLVSVGVQMHPTMEPKFNSSTENIRMRYFVLSPDFMKAHKLDGPAVRKLSYATLTEMLNVAP